MQHLTLEELARLIDESPAYEERAHLDRCGVCRHELEEMRCQTTALAGLPSLDPPAEDWDSLEARLYREGLIRPDIVPQRTRSRYRVAPLLQMAAGLVLFVLGGLVGAALTSEWGAAPVTAAADADPVYTAASTTDEAARALQEAQAAYLSALANYTEMMDTPFGLDPVARLAAIEGIMLTTRAALQEAPADPVINSYHLSAVGQREATIRQIARQAEEPWF